ncbi:MAG: hypothetical protein NZT61_03465 [Deltaproteobacteria bacterium]|nr:hypothetical protein [Deltaproteobacteria bacterium]
MKALGLQLRLINLESRLVGLKIGRKFGQIERAKQHLKELSPFQLKDPAALVKKTVDMKSEVAMLKSEMEKLNRLKDKISEIIKTRIDKEVSDGERKIEEEILEQKAVSSSFSSVSYQEAAYSVSSPPKEQLTYQTLYALVSDGEKKVLIENVQIEQQTYLNFFLSGFRQNKKNEFRQRVINVVKTKYPKVCVNDVP